MYNIVENEQIGLQYMILSQFPNLHNDYVHIPFFITALGMIQGSPQTHNILQNQGHVSDYTRQKWETNEYGTRPVRIRAQNKNTNRFKNINLTKGNELK